MTDIRADLARMPRYKCHKVVHALKIQAIDDIRLSFVEPGYAALFVGTDFIRKHVPHAGGYLVVYQDGYLSFSPAAAFEDGYTRLID